jgi:hypothetical protein
VLRTNDTIITLTQPKKELFAKLEKDYTDVKKHIKEQVSIVYNFKDSRSKRVPWLKLTAFLYHITTLKDEEI